MLDTARLNSSTVRRLQEEERMMQQQQQQLVVAKDQVRDVRAHVPVNERKDYKAMMFHSRLG
jgi:hypothetical protein